MKHLKKYNESNDPIIWVAALDDDDNYIPISCPLSSKYTGPNALPHFDTYEECLDWCKANPYKGDESDELYEESLEEKMLKRKLKMYGETLTLGQMECVIDAMKEVSLQRKMGNWTNKPK